MATYGTFDIDSVPCPHDCEFERAPSEQRPLTVTQVANILKDAGYHISICENLVHARSGVWLLPSLVVEWTLGFNDTVQVWDSPWGVSVLCMEDE